jgi:hypothetical protein
VKFLPTPTRVGRLLVPPLSYLAIAHTIVFAMDTPLADRVFNLLIAWLCLGCFVVYGVLKTPMPQSVDRLDWRGAASALYRAAWWPWYLLRSTSPKGRP